MSFLIVSTVKFQLAHIDEREYKKIGAVFKEQICQTEQDFLAVTQDADAIVTAMVQVNRNVIEHMRKCRIIQTIGIGYEGVDVKAATECGICVVNVPDYCTDEVSDHTMALILACARKLRPLMLSIERGYWDSYAKPRIRRDILPPMFKLRGQTLGLIGLGKIARFVAAKAKGFGMNIIAYDPYLPPDVASDLGVTLTDIKHLIQTSDFISVHSPLTKDTHHLLSTDQFKMMKKTAYVINTSRGPLIDEEALYIALTEHLIAGAALDVMEQEPPATDNPILKLDNVIITPHIAHYSDESEKDVSSRPEQEIFRVLNGKWPISLVNPEVKENFVKRWGTMT